MAGGLLSAARADDNDRRRPDAAQMHSARNDSGVAVTISTNGFIDRRNPFFRELGGNERSCVTCHQPNEGWTITPKGLRDRFKDTKGNDPVFRLVDGANSPKADVSTKKAREKAYSMLLDRGPDPDRPADPGDGAVRAGPGRRPVRLRVGAASSRSFAGRWRRPTCVS